MKEKEDDLRKYCFSAAYIHGVLKTGFELTEPFDQVQIVSDINGVGIDWAIGSVLYEAMNLPPLDVWPPDAVRLRIQFFFHFERKNQFPHNVCCF